MRNHGFPTRTHLRVLSASGLVLAAVIPPSAFDDSLTICPFRLITGVPCPACGLVRSVVATMHGDAYDSLQLHPFGMVAVLVMITLALGLDRRFPAVTAVVLKRSTLSVVAVLWLGSWVARLVTGFP